MRRKGEEEGREPSPFGGSFLWAAPLCVVVAWAKPCEGEGQIHGLLCKHIKAMPV